MIRSRITKKKIADKNAPSISSMSDPAHQRKSMRDFALQNSIHRPPYWIHPNIGALY